MPNYRRLYIPGGTYFFTVNLKDRRQSLLTDNIDILRTVYENVQRRHPFETLAICILPNHLHCIWQMPDGDANFSMRWRQIKSGFSRALPKSEDTTHGGRKGERGIWQRRFWEHLIENDKEYGETADYIHYNPVKHGLTKEIENWPYSSWHKHFGNKDISGFK